jgi:NOL1/NOP2/sun family putative RNA methylase
MNNDFDCYRDIIPEFPLFQESLQRPLPTHIRVNTLKTSPKQMVDSLTEKGVHLDRAFEKIDTLYLAPGLKSPGNLIEYFLGYIHPQTLTSCLAAVVLSPKEHSSVLDMCAAPGGKTAHLAQLMNNTGLIVANELYRNRLNPLGATLARLGALNTVVTSYQAQEFPRKQRFDFVLADVPCTGEGRARRSKTGGFDRKADKRNKLSDLQKKIILRGFDLLTQTGEMLYATCTYNPGENESVVDFLLKKRGDARILPLDDDFGHDPAVTEWKDHKYDKQIQRAARFYPHRIDSVGFFMARVGKK